MVERERCLQGRGPRVTPLLNERVLQGARRMVLIRSFCVSLPSSDVHPACGTTASYGALVLSFSASVVRRRIALTFLPMSFLDQLAAVTTPCA